MIRFSSFVLKLLGFIIALLLIVGLIRSLSNSEPRTLSDSLNVISNFEFKTTEVFDEFKDYVNSYKEYDASQSDYKWYEAIEEGFTMVYQTIVLVVKLVVFGARDFVYAISFAVYLIL